MGNVSGKGTTGREGEHIMEKITQDDYDKAMFQLRSQLNAVWNFANCYGLNDDVKLANEESIKLAEQFSMRTRGKDVPIKVRNTPRRKLTE